MRFNAGFAVLLVCGTARCQVQQPPPGTSQPIDGSAAAEDATARTLQKAEALLQAENWAAATVLLKPLAQRQPGNPQVQYDLGFCLDAQNDGPGAEGAYRRALAADPQRVAAGVSLGLLLARMGDAPGAISVLANAVTLHGGEDAAAKAQAYRALARLRLASAPAQSRDDLVQALRLSPETPDDTQLAGEIAEALGDEDAAAAAYGKVLRNSPIDPQAALQYARVLQRSGHTIEADATLDAALQAHPDSPPLLGERAASLLRVQKVDQARPLLERLHAGDPGNAAYTRLLAQAYLLQNDPARAETLLRSLTAADPGSGTLQTELADTLMRQKRYAEAQVLLERALAATFETPSARAKAAFELAFAASANNQPQTVLRAISIRNEIEPLDATSAFLVATAHDTLHQPREAAGAYRQFLQLANGRFPDEETQANQRLKVLSRAK